MREQEGGGKEERTNGRDERMKGRASEGARRLASLPPQTPRSSHTPHTPHTPPLPLFSSTLPTLPKLPILPALLLALTLTACDNAVAPYTEDGPFPFALFGYLDTAADTQYVRATPVHRGEAAPPDPAEVELVLVRTSTGERTAWQGRPVRLDDGTDGYEFYAALPIVPGEVYRLEASGGGGAEVSALTRVPEPLPAGVGEVRQGRVLLQEVVFPDVRPRPLRPAMHYRVAPGPGEPPREVVIPYGPSIAQTGDGSLRLTVRLSADRDAILEQLGCPEGDTAVVLLGLGLAYERLSGEWPPPDPPAPLDGGLGFFGSVGHFFETWTLPDSTTRRLGFAVPPP